MNLWSMRGEINETLTAFIVLLVSTSMLMAKGNQENMDDPIKLGGVWPLADITGEQAVKAAEMTVKEIKSGMVPSIRIIPAGWQG